MIIRHAEKPPDDGGTPHGVKPNGSADEHSLTIAGWTRAGALVPFFATPSVTGIESPAVIYAASSNSPYGSHGKRPAQTIRPLAARLNIAPNVTYAVGEEAALAADVLAASGPVLIAWEHVAITSIIQHLGLSAFTTTWDKRRFDQVWCLHWTAGTYAFSIIDQQLLADDAGV